MSQGFLKMSATRFLIDLIGLFDIWKRGIKMNDLVSPVYDVAIIGAGIVGCAIARELSQYELRCVLVEAQNDVGAGTSKANTAILHTGYDGKPGLLEAKLVRRGYELLKSYGASVGIPIEYTGGLLVAWDEDQLQSLPRICEIAHQNGVVDVKSISTDELYKREPHLGPGALGALEVPRESLICPFTTPLAFATQAVINGVGLRLNSPVQTIETSYSGDYLLQCPNQQIYCRFIVNAAGLYSDTINRMMGHEEFEVTPRRGELIVFDKMARSLIHHILMPVPSKVTKGVMVCPTVFGNVLLGPTAEDLGDKTATETTESGLANIWDKGAKILPPLIDYEVTALYAGLRAATEHSDYQIYLHSDARYVCVGGIRSTGLTASMAIAEYALELLGEAGLPLKHKAKFKTMTMPNIGERSLRPYQREDWIRTNPDYGRIVCHCERVTKGEILDAARAEIPARDFGGLRRRTRAMFGRCQGFFCAAEITALLAEASGVSIDQLHGLEQSDENS
jgi:glycerol-3-phosphate dehydrogenase